jgi:hypothetical protein
MSWRKELRAIRQERADLIRRGELLRIRLKWKVATVLMYVEVADQVISFVGRFIGGGRTHRSSRPSK